MQFNLQSSPFSLRPAAARKKAETNNWMILLRWIGIALAALVFVISLQSIAGLRLMAAGFLLLLLVQLIWRLPTVGIVLTYGFLTLLGGIRRWLIPDFGWPTYDPLILLGPLVALICFLPLVLARQIPANTPLSKWTKYLLLVMFVQIFNPLQGGLLVGFGGVIYYIVPLLWFYLGRTRGSVEISRILMKAAVILICLVAIYGMKQVFFGLSSSEAEWVKLGGYTALNVSDEAMRVFSTFASQQEYAAILSCAITICTAFVFQKKYLFLLPIAILLPSLFFTGTRGPVAFGLCAICVQWALMGRNKAVWLPRLALAFALGVAGLVGGLTSVSNRVAETSQSDLIKHQQEGLLDPANSTAPGHFVLASNGIIYGITHPLGLGLGASTLAAGKMGGEAFGAETDHSNLFISLGIGGVLYLIVNFFIFKELLALWVKSRDVIFLCTAGILIASFSQWANGALYSLTFLIWFNLGCVDRYYATESVKTIADSNSPSAPGRGLRFKSSRRPRSQRTEPHHRMRSPRRVAPRERIA